jgi:hypothetical protein
MGTRPGRRKNVQHGTKNVQFLRLAVLCPIGARTCHLRGGKDAFNAR